ncbi:unnamed protein product [Jaminaea pallidilutea]
MFSALLHAPCELQLHLLQSVIFLYPTHRRGQQSPDPEGPPSQTDSLVRGLVELWVPTPRHISGIKVKLRAIQTVAILDPSSGLVPVSWEDKVLMEREVLIGMSPKSHTSGAGASAGTNHHKERGRTPGPSGFRFGSSSAASSRAPSPVADRGGQSQPPSRPPSRGPSSRNVTARNSTDEPHEPEREGRNRESRGIGSAFARAVSRGRPSPANSRPASRAASRSRAHSPAADRRNLTSYASTSNAHAARSASTAPSVLPASPLPSPRDEDHARPPLGRSGSELHARLASLSVGQDVERQRSASNADGLGHPDDDNFGINGNATPSQATQSSASAVNVSGRGGFARQNKGSGSVPPSLGKQKEREKSVGWPRWSRSVSRARGSGAREPHPKRDANRREVSGATADGHAEHEEPTSGIELGKGVHGFEFAFIIPADAAEYTRSPFGRVRYVIKATAYGAGRAKSNVEAWRDCFPVANPSMEGGPTPLTVLYNDLHPTVGLLSVACTSQNISVGGGFQVDIHSPVPPPDLIVYLVRISVETTIEIHTRRKGKQVIPSQRSKIFEKGYVPPRRDDPYGSADGKKSEGLIRDPARDGRESAWTVQALARMPDDNTIRSSTMGGTKSAIRFSHQFVVEVIHSREADRVDEERRLKVFTLRQPFTLPSCCVAFDAATLPAYTPASSGDAASHGHAGGLPYDLAHLPNGERSHTDAVQGSTSTEALANAGGSMGVSSPRPSTLLATPGTAHDYCVCGLSLQDLEARERATMMPPQSAQYDIPIDALRPHGKIGELPADANRARRRLSRSRSSRRGSSSSGQRSASLVGSHRRNASTSSSTSTAAGSVVGATLARSVSRRDRSSSVTSSTSNLQSGLSRTETRRSSTSGHSRGRGTSGIGGAGIAPNFVGGTPVGRTGSGASHRSLSLQVGDRRHRDSLSALPESGHPPDVGDGEAPPSYDAAVHDEEEDRLPDRQVHT